MKKLTALIFLCILYASGSAQAKWDLSVAGQAARISNIDKEFSALPFSAILPGAGISIKYLGQHFTHNLQVSYLGGSLQTSSHPAYRQDQHYLNIDYTGLYTIGAPDAAWQGAAGIALQTLYDERTYPALINKNNSYDFVASLGLAGSITHSFNNIWYLSDDLSVLSPATVSSFLKIKNAATIHRNISIHSKLSLAYSWDFYKIGGHRDVRQACHRMELAYHLIF